MRWFFVAMVVGLSAAGCKSQAPVCDPFFGRTTIPPPPTGSVTGRPADPNYQPPPLAPGASLAPSALAPPTVQMPCQPSPQPAVSQPAPVMQPFVPQPLAPPTVTTQPSSPLQPTSPPGLAPNVAAPRPTSTGSSPVPGSAPPASTPAPSYVPPSAPSSAPSSVPSPPAGNSPYAPPGGSFNYRGASTQSSMPSVLTQPNVRVSAASSTNSSATGMVPAGGAALAGGSGGRTPIIRTLQPRGGDDTSPRPVDILDLPKLP